MEPPSTHLSLFAAMLGGKGRDQAWETFFARYAPLIRAWCARWGLRDACSRVKALLAEMNPTLGGTAF